MIIEKIINEAWENKDQVSQNSDKSLKDAVNQIIDDLDSGKARVAEKINGEWVTHQHLKKAIMLSFRMYPMENLNGPYSSWYDKAHLLKGKTAGWTKEDHEKAGFRMVPNSPVRKGSFVGKNAVLMPCYVNIGAYIDEGTMMDTFSRAGSCCQIGKNCQTSVFKMGIQYPWESWIFGFQFRTSDQKYKELDPASQIIPQHKQDQIGRASCRERV